LNGPLQSSLVRQFPSKNGRGSSPLPPPWRADNIPGGYVVRDANGQTLAYVYSRMDATEALQAKTLTTDEGRLSAAPEDA
jgi:hypothetical protein